MGRRGLVQRGLERFERTPFVIQGVQRGLRHVLVPQLEMVERDPVFTGR